MARPDLAGLRAAFGGRLLTSEEETAPFLTDWRRMWRGSAVAVAQPDTTEDVAAVVRWCVAERVPIVPQGGNTGMSGAATPDPDGRGLVLSLARLTRIREIDPVNNTMTVEAGCILQRVQEAAQSAGRLFPLSLAAEGSCTLGGNLATNAGGTAVLRYGNARELCLGLEVVTPAGEIWNGLRGLRKDNTGYDLRDLYIGSEGTLGIITAAVLKLFPQPGGRAVAWIAVASVDAALQLLDLAQGRLGPALTAFELVSDVCLTMVLQHGPGLRSPLAASSPWYVLLEVSHLTDDAAAAADLQNLMEAAFEAGPASLASDAALASSLAQAQALWALRENISESQGRAGETIKHDISLPISRIATFITEAERAVTTAFPDLRLVIFGHLGDGNLHYNISPPDCARDLALAERQAPINRIVHDLVSRHGGSISAEHGLGVLRRAEALRYKPPVEIALARAIKTAFDPLGLMNPGKGLA